MATTHISKKVKKEVVKRSAVVNLFLKLGAIANMNPITLPFKCRLYEFFIVGVVIKIKVTKKYNILFTNVFFVLFFKLI